MCGPQIVRVIQTNVNRNVVNVLMIKSVTTQQENVQKAASCGTSPTNVISLWVRARPSQQAGDFEPLLV